MFRSLAWVALLSLVYKQAIAGPVPQPEVRVRTPPGRSPRDIVEAVRRGLGAAANESRALEWKGSTPLDRSWDGAVLLQLGMEQSTEIGTSERHSLDFTAGIEIVCTKCYMTGLATAELTAERWNVSVAVDQTLDQVGENISNLTSEVGDYVSDYFDAIDWPLDLDDLEMPTFDYDFSMDVPSLPDVNLRFGFDSLELYMMLDTTLSLGSTYTYSLYRSQSPIGYSLAEDLELGIIFTVDLILSVDGQIDISSGFHLKLDDGLAIDIALFGKDPSGIAFNGGQFEFLPVTVESAGIVFTAILRLGVHAGFSVNPDFGLLTTATGFDLGAGIEVGVFANVAELTTNVTYQPGNADCELGIEQAYSFALGAAAGATVAIGDQTWGPAPETTTPIWYTTFASACPLKGTPTMPAPANNTAVITPAAYKRQQMSTATIVTTVTYTGVNCLSAGMVHCPASLQNTSQSTATKTFTTVVPSGMDESDISLPATVSDTVATTFAFGVGAMNLPMSSGKPVSWVPPPSPTHTSNAIAPIQDEIEDITNRPRIIGLSVGLGGAFVIVLLAVSIILCRRRQKYTAVPRIETVDMRQDSSPYERFRSAGRKAEKDAVRISEMRPLSRSPGL